MKRCFDFLCAFMGLIIFSPFLIIVMLIIWLHDRHSPFYIATRIGLNGREFKMVKLRSMIFNADKSGVDSTSGDDNRITAVGHFIRRFKLDEVSQLYNVLIGDMSLVGPRPNVKRETNSYTDEEKKLLSVRPGITDFASIVFSDEGEILKGKTNPDLVYNQLIRPYKSRLGLFYIENRGFWLDVSLCILTITTLLSRRLSLTVIQRILISYDADELLVNVARRKNQLQPAPPPGAKAIVTKRS